MFSQNTGDQPFICFKNYNKRDVCCVWAIGSEAIAVKRDSTYTTYISFFHELNTDEGLITVRPLLLRMLRQPMLNNLCVRVALYKCAIDPLGALDTLSCCDDKLARLSLIELASEPPLCRQLYSMAL